MTNKDRMLSYFSTDHFSDWIIDSSAQMPQSPKSRLESGSPNFIAWNPQNKTAGRTPGSDPMHIAMLLAARARAEQTMRLPAG